MNSSKDAKKPDPYAVLGVSPDDDDETVKRAHRKLSVRHHPDLNPGDQTAAAEFREAEEAYEMIDTEDKRRKLRRKAGANLSHGAEGAVVSYFAKIFQTEGER